MLSILFLQMGRGECVLLPPSLTVRLTSDNLEDSHPAIAVDLNGKNHIVWNKFETTANGRTYSHLKYATDKDGEFVVVNMTTGKVNDRRADIDITSHGEIVTSFVRLTPPLGGKRYDVWFGILDQEGHWQFQRVTNWAGNSTAPSLRAVPHVCIGYSTFANSTWKVRFAKLTRDGWSDILVGDTRITKSIFEKQTDVLDVSWVSLASFGSIYYVAYAEVLNLTNWSANLRVATIDSENMIVIRDEAVPSPVKGRWIGRTQDIGVQSNGTLVLSAFFRAREGPALFVGRRTSSWGFDKIDAVIASGRLHRTSLAIDGNDRLYVAYQSKTTNGFEIKLANNLEGWDNQFITSNRVADFYPDMKLASSVRIVYEENVPSTILVLPRMEICYTSLDYSRGTPSAESGMTVPIDEGDTTGHHTGVLPCLSQRLQLHTRATEDPWPLGSLTHSHDATSHPTVVTNLREVLSQSAYVIPMRQML